MELRENYLRPSADPSMGWHSFFRRNDCKFAWELIPLSFRTIPDENTTPHEGAD